MSETSALTTGPNSNSPWQKGDTDSAGGCEHKKVKSAFPTFSEVFALVGLLHRNR